MEADVKNVSPEKEQQELQVPPGLITVIFHLQLERTNRKIKHWLTFSYLFFPPFLPVMQQLSVIFMTYTSQFCGVLLSLLQLPEHMLCPRAGSHSLAHTEGS